MKIPAVVTGATGMLGRATMARFATIGDFATTGLCHSRRGEGLVPLDLTDFAAVEAFLDKVRPEVVIHTAAIRRPDEFAADAAAARRLNVDTTALLARWVAAHPGAFLVYISSDYVFDGTQPPYFTDSPTHAINGYGASKLAGEDVVRSAAADQSAILRVPILYGDVESLDESSVTTVLAQVMKLARPGNETYSKSRPLILDDWATRYPTHVADVADILAQIAVRRLAGTFHWSGDEAMTKLDMGRVVAGQMGIDASLLKGSGAPANGSEPRPKDCHLDRSLLELRGVTTPGTPFAVAVRRLLARFAGAPAAR
ncbi:MAG: dTDP-4-dehydrorhamnose reductase family protein [Kiritimatiellia bacterium]